MRLPKSWDDTSLLEDEPFCSCFAACALADSGPRGREEVRKCLDFVSTEALPAEDGGKAAAYAWTQMAFPTCTTSDPGTESAVSRVYRVFVEFYWKMHQRKDQAYSFLQNERKNRGYSYILVPNDSAHADLAHLMSDGSRGKKKLAWCASVAAKENVIRGRPQDDSPVEPLHDRISTAPPQNKGLHRAKRHKGGSNPSDHEINPVPRVLQGADSSLLAETSKSTDATSRRKKSTRWSKVSKIENIIPKSFPEAESSRRGSRGVVLRPHLPSSVNVAIIPSIHPAKPLGTGSSRMNPHGLLSPPDLPLPVDVDIIPAGQPAMPSEAKLFGISFHGPSFPSDIPSHVDVDIIPTSKQAMIWEPGLPSQTVEPFHTDMLVSNELLADIESNLPSGTVPGLLGVERTAEEESNWLTGSSSRNDAPDAVENDDTSLSSAGQRASLVDARVLSRYKLPLPMLPPIWAQSRQEVCESFDWFRSYQGGVYYANNVAKGYLLSAFSSRRDLFEHEGRLIISHGGGKAESLHTHKGETTTQLADDQLAQDKSVRALLSNYKERRPLVLLIDDKYALFPYDLCAKDVTYAVLGFYTIAHVWAEFQPANNQRGRVVRYKFAFQWCDGQGEPWWLYKENTDMAVDEPPFPCPSVPDRVSITRSQNSRPLPAKVSESKFSDLRPSRPDNIYLTCRQCSEKSPHVYRGEWTCLNPTCVRFWTTSDGNSLPTQLEYNPSFLKLLAPFVLQPSLRNLRPPPPVSLIGSGITTSYLFSRGWHCTQCGRLSCRFKWEHWECAHCQFTFKVPGTIHGPKDFWAQTIPASFRDHFILKISGINQLPARTFSHGHGLGQTQTFILPNGRGQIHHIQGGSPSGNSEADVIFREYQEQALTGDLPFRRWPLRTHKCRGALLTNYFSQNTGEPYQYVGGTANTIPFSQVPSAVSRARDLIQRRILMALEVSSQFNEVLSAAYMERQKMAFHSDSEPGLGPLVAGLSLGSPALIHFRLHSKYQPDQERRQVAMSFVLRHGDILVMDGAGVQQYYEHTVVPTNFRIAATARWINPKHS